MEPAQRSNHEEHAPFEAAETPLEQAGVLSPPPASAPAPSSPLNRPSFTIAALAGTFISRTFDSLALPDYRMLWLGLMGSWMAMQLQQTARGYLAYTLTNSPLALGLVTLSTNASDRRPESLEEQNLRVVVPNEKADHPIDRR